MDIDNSLPADFDGVFRFTNFTDSEFRAKYNSVEYIFPPLSTVPLIISTASPVEIQFIRKKFAKELGIREFYKSKKFQGMDKTVPGGVPATYTDSDLTPFIQKCLEPLPISKVTTKAVPKDNEDKYRKDGKGRNVTKVLEDGESLLSQGSGQIE